MENFGEHKITKVTPGRLRKDFETVVGSSSVSISGGFRSSTCINDTDFQTMGLDFYMQKFKVSNSCLNYISKQLKPEISFVLKWNLFDKDDSAKSASFELNKGNFDYTTHYDFILDKEFTQIIQESPIIFRLYATSLKDELFLSETQLIIPHIMQVINIKQEDRIIFRSSIIDAHGGIIAYVDLWYKFTCKQIALKTLFNKNHCNYGRRKSIHQTTKMSQYLNNDFSEKSHNFGSLIVTESELDHFADSVWLVLNRNKVLKTTQSDMNNELKQRVRWLHFEANWKQTLQEHAILHGLNPKDVIWRQWREENTANIKLRTYDNITPKKYASKLSITVVDLCFLEGSSVLRNEEMKQFYIEYSFLDYTGPQMEAPYSKPKAKAEEKIVFNFKKTFPIHIKRNRENCIKLTELIKNDGVIKFVVISEPVVNPERPIQTCQEVGYAEVPISEIIQLESNVGTYEFEVIDIHNQIAVLGYITVTVNGILAMRRMALRLMAPRGYKLFS